MWQNYTDYVRGDVHLVTKFAYLWEFYIGVVKTGRRQGICCRAYIYSNWQYVSDNNTRAQSCHVLGMWFALAQHYCRHARRHIRTSAGHAVSMQGAAQNQQRCRGWQITGL